MIIGLTGKNAAGKGEAAKYLEAKGYTYFSLSDELRAEATARGLTHTREEMIKLGTELREEKGVGYLAGKINEKIKEMKEEGKNKFVVDSIRNPGEIEELQKNEDFTLVGVEATPEVRFERMVNRGRAGDAKNVEDFKKMEEKERKGGKASQQLEACLEMADILIGNDESLEELHKEMDKVEKVAL